MTNKVNRRLKALRQLKNLNQNDVAKMLGLSIHGYLNKENGKTKFNLDEAKFLADLFGVTVDEFFFGDNVISMITGTLST